jgi:mRNA interferase MazF
MVNYPRRDEVWLITPDPSLGFEIKKTRPCLVISPNEMNEPLGTAIVAPMTTSLRTYPTRVNVSFRGKAGQVALDQLRAVDRQRLVRRLGTISSRAADEVSDVLLEMFTR